MKPPSTRRRIADAAATLFSTRGYGATSLQQVADAAGVHVQTIYQAFGTKPAVLAAALDSVRAGTEDADQPPEQWPWARALVAEIDPVRQLALFARHVAEIAPRAGPLLAEIRNAARSDDELAMLLARIQDGRYLGPSGIVDILRGNGVLRSGLDPKAAADTMYAIASYESYDLLVGDRGYSRKGYERWLTATLARALLDPDIAPTSGGRSR